ncbi:jg23420 [Pararge aegeria aegeria]|uniref:Jg23420 protein n=1 Tax=Pararge aegeria aegeria TaxID=348720 RepID=A0A8S4QWR6_9NEOP|nr:jg23420 [Pararge aegeria aegeria]
MTLNFREFDKDSSDDSSEDDSDHEVSEMEQGVIDSSVDTEEDDENENNKDDQNSSDDSEDEVVKAIKAEKNKPRDHPPSIKTEDFIVDICFHPANNIIAIANIVGDVLLYEYSNDETNLLKTMELHLKACRDVEFDNNGVTMFTTAKDKAVMATDVESGKLKQCFENAHDEPVYKLFPLDCNKIVSGMYL